MGKHCYSYQHLGCSTSSTHGWNYKHIYRQAHEEAADDARSPTPQIRCRSILHPKKGEEAFTALNPVCNRNSLSQYVNESEETLLKCVLNEGVMKQWDGKTSEVMKQEKRERQHN